MANPMENYVRALSKLETRISNIERNNQSQAFTSIENTRLEFRDEDGNITGTLGIQDDGSTGFVPVLPAPEVKEPRVLAVPSAPLLDESVSAVSVTWDGLTIDHAELPLDFYCLEIHASETEDFEASDLTLVSALYEEQGSSSVVGPIISGTWYFRLRLRARNGEVSEASVANSIEVTLDLPELNDVLANASGGNNFYQPDPPVPGENGFGPNDLWFDSSEDENGIVTWMPHRWDPTANGGAGGWVSIEDQRMEVIKNAQEDIRVELNETQQKASDAQASADSAVTLATTAQTTADEAKTDASAKALAAEQAAKAYADAEAEAARLAAIATASGDATDKANAAHAKAIADAALDASQKAAQAQQAAEAKAAEAKSAADAAKAVADDAKARADAAHTAAGNAQNAADAAIVAASHNAKNLFSTANPTGTAPKGTIWFKTDSSGRIIGQWQQTGGTDTSVGSTWTLRELTNSVIANLDAGKIVSGYIDVARLKANSIGADKLLIGSDRNLIPNGDLSSGTIDGWPTRFTYQNTDTPGDYAGAASISGTTSAGWSSTLYPVVAGDTVIFEVWIKADKPNSKVVQEVRDQIDAHLGRAGSPWTSVEGSAANTNYPLTTVFTVPTTWTKVTSKITIPAGVTGIRLGTFYPNHSSGTERTATVSVAGLKVFKQVGKTLIEDGAVTTEKIATGAITAESGVIGSLDLGKATVGELDGVRIKAGTINTDQLNSTAINGMEIVAAKIYTSKTGARIQLLTTGLSAYSASNVRTFNIASNTGDVEMIGKLFTGASGGYRTVLNQESWNDFSEFPIYGGGSAKTPMVGSGLRLGKDGSVTTSAEMFYAEETYSSGTVSKYLRLNGPTVSSRRSELAIGTSGVVGGYRNTSNGLFLSSVSLDKSSANLRHEAPANGVFSVVNAGEYSDGTPFATMWTSNTSASGDNNSVTVSKDGIDLTAGDAVFGIRRSSGNLTMNAAGWQWSNYYEGTSAANVYMTSAGWFQRGKSSRRYKLLEKPITEDIDNFSQKILSIEPKSWFDKNASERWAEIDTLKATGKWTPEMDEEYIPDPLERIPGVIAEDLHDAGLSMFVDYDEDGLPDGVKYDRIGVALIAVLKEQNKRIEQLEDLIANT
ncbi:hypothetical protein ACP6NG_17965 [Brevibacterium casei]|uniref:hypothetical protein n=1 Tax=Brevibacterium casei TaxID=33889 RepID=UPI003F8020FC